MSSGETKKELNKKLWQNSKFDHEEYFFSEWNAVVCWNEKKLIKNKKSDKVTGISLNKLKEEEYKRMSKFLEEDERIWWWPRS